MQEVKKKYKAELTTDLREEYGISKMVPFHNPMQPPPAANSNIGFSNIKMKSLDANDLNNPMKRNVPTKRPFESLVTNTPPKKRVASAAELKTYDTKENQNKP